MQNHASSPLLAKRQARTWLAIHQAAQDQAIEHGPDCVTVAKIAELAGVSQRTFFNYFDSKDDAILGVKAPRITEESLAELASATSDSAVLRVARLVTDVGSSTRGPGVDLVRRRELTKSSASLRARLAQLFGQSRELITAELVDEAQTPWHGMAGFPEDPMAARALVMLASSVVAFAWSTEPDRLFTERDDVLAEAISQYRKVASTFL